MSLEKDFGEKKSERPKVERITINDLKPEIPKLGGVEIVLQRNAKDNRNPDSSLEMGALMPEAVEQTKQKAQEFFDQTFQLLGPEEMKNVDILVVAADTKLETPIPGIKSDRKRAVETAEEVLAGIKESLKKFSLPETQLLNQSGKPIELSSGRLRDLYIFEDSPEFVKFLTDKYGTGKEFWIAFENDDEKETREKMGAEGPAEIATRMEGYLKTINNAMKFYHQSHPNRRVIVWAVSHYDSISPFIKKNISGMEQADYLPVDNGAGIVINVGKDQKATSKIQDHEYNLSLAA